MGNRGGSHTKNGDWGEGEGTGPWNSFTVADTAVKQSITRKANLAATISVFLIRVCCSDPYCSLSAMIPPELAHDTWWQYCRDSNHSTCDTVSFL